MKTVISWNVNGIRACLSKPASATVLASFLQAYPDCTCIALQETKMQCAMWDGLLPLIHAQLPGWHVYHADSVAKKGYAGTALLLRHPPSSVDVPCIDCGEDDAGQDAGKEGRVITAIYDGHAITSVYTCNSGRGGGLGRLGYRTERWDVAFKAYCEDLLRAHRQRNPDFQLVVAGDLNVAHEDIDLARPDENRNTSAGFTDAERAGLRSLLLCGSGGGGLDGTDVGKSDGKGEAAGEAAGGLRDSFRELHPEATAMYSWWPYRSRGARE